MEKKKKLIELIIDETAELFGVEAISVVKYPAIEENFVFFNQDFLTLAKLDEEQRQLVGAVLIPDKKIIDLIKTIMKNMMYSLLKKLLNKLRSYLWQV